MEGRFTGIVEAEEDDRVFCTSAGGNGKQAREEKSTFFAGGVHVQPLGQVIHVAGALPYRVHWVLRRFATLVEGGSRGAWPVALKRAKWRELR